jgi:hypothetical protein
MNRMVFTFLAICLCITLVVAVDISTYLQQANRFYVEQSEISLQRARLAPEQLRAMSVNQGASAASADPTASLQYLVHVKGGESASLRAEIETLLQRPVSAYIPHNTFVVYCTPIEASAIGHVSGVKAVAPYQAAHRVEASLEATARSCALASLSTEGASANVVLSVLPIAGSLTTVAAATARAAQWASLTRATVRHASPGVIELVIPCHRAGIVQSPPLFFVVVWRNRFFKQGRDAEAALALLQSQPEVHWIERAPHHITHNKYARGIVQTASASRTPLQDAGVTGAGQVVGCADTGLDTSLCWFNDPTRPVIPGTVDMAQRKVVLYQPLVDEEDEGAGHGTHVVGSICGAALDNSSLAAAYDGVAAGARIAFQGMGGRSGRDSAKLRGVLADIGDASGLELPADLAVGLFPFPYLQGLHPVSVSENTITHG